MYKCNITLSIRSPDNKQGVCMYPHGHISWMTNVYRQCVGMPGKTVHIVTFSTNI